MEKSWRRNKRRQCRSVAECGLDTRSNPSLLRPPRILHHLRRVTCRTATDTRGPGPGRAGPVRLISASSLSPWSLILSDCLLLLCSSLSAILSTSGDKPHVEKQKKDIRPEIEHCPRQLSATESGPHFKATRPEPYAAHYLQRNVYIPPPPTPLSLFYAKHVQLSRSFHTTSARLHCFPVNECPRF